MKIPSLYSRALVVTAVALSSLLPFTAPAQIVVDSASVQVNGSGTFGFQPDQEPYFHFDTIDTDSGTSSIDAQVIASAQPGGVFAVATEPGLHFAGSSTVTVQSTSLSVISNLHVQFHAYSRLVIGGSNALAFGAVGELYEYVGGQAIASVTFHVTEPVIFNQSRSFFPTQQPSPLSQSGYGTNTSTIAASRGTLLPGQTYTFTTQASVSASTWNENVFPFGEVFPFGSVELNVTPALRVTTTADVVNATDNQTSLREAVAFAATNPGADTITFAPGLSGQTITLGSPIVLGSEVTLDASSLPAGVTISGGNVCRIFSVNAGTTATLRALKLTGGNGTGGSFPGEGGAIFNQGTLTLEDCTLSGNTATESGGALYTYSSSVTLTRCTFSGNSAGAYGGAIRSAASTITLTHCTLSGNVSFVEGGALHVSADSSITLLHSTVTANSSYAGGGIFVFNQIEVFRVGEAAQAPPPPAQDLMVLRHTIVSGNLLRPLNVAADDIAGPANARFCLIGSTSGVEFYGDSGANITGVNALLGPLASNGGRTQTHALLNGSPAFNAGDAAFTPPPATDQRGSGFPRVQHGRIDIGAYESATVLASQLTLWRQSNGLPIDGSQDLATPAGDGVPNLLKFAFNMAPSPGDFANPNVQVLVPNGTSGLPRTSRDSQGRLVIEFIARSSGASGISYLVETGTSLGNLQPLNLESIGAIVTPIDADWSRVTVIDPTVTSPRFGRVRVQASP